MMSSASLGTSRSPLSPVLPLREGDLLGGRYRLESLLHARTTGVLYAATDLKTGARVTAHVLAAPSGDATRGALLAGARRAQALTSAYAARVLDVGATNDGHPWSIREHLGSDTLEAHLRKHGALSTTDAIDVALAICDAVAEAHAHDILHLSLGPRGVHVAWSASGLAEVKVTGVGSASAEIALALGSTGDVECVLRSPEQLRHGSKVDARADVWAIAVLLHTMLAGAPPFAADTPSGASLSVVIDDPPSLAGVPDELADIVERSLAKEPAQRPRTVLELADAIASFGSKPDLARERIAKRRARLESKTKDAGLLNAHPLELVLPTESEPTLIVHEEDYAALAGEQPKAAAQPAAPADPPVLAAAKSTLTKPPAAKPAAAPTVTSSKPPPASAIVASPPATKVTLSKPPPAADAPSAKANGLKTLALGSVNKVPVSKPPPPPPSSLVAAAEAAFAPAAKELAVKPPAPTGPQLPAAAPSAPAESAPASKAAEPEPTMPLDSEDLIVDPAPPSVRSLAPSEPIKPLLPTLVKPAPGTTDTTSKQAVRRESRFPRRAFQAIGLMTAAACVTLLVLVGTEGAQLSKKTAPPEAKENTARAVAAAAFAPPPPAPTDLPPPVMRPSDLPGAPLAAPPQTAAAHTNVAPPVAAPPPARPAPPPAPVAVEPAPARTPAPEAPHAAAPAAPKRPSASPASTAASQPSPSGSSDDLRRFLDDRH